jgi:hypothetical protein
MNDVQPVDLVQKVEFDIAVTVSANSGSKASGQGSLAGKAIMVLQATVSISGETKREKTHTNASRIKFTVPVLFEGQEIIFHKKSSVQLRNKRTAADDEMAC